MELSQEQLALLRDWLQSATPQTPVAPVVASQIPPVAPSVAPVVAPPKSAATIVADLKASLSPAAYDLVVQAFTDASVRFGCGYSALGKAILGRS